MSRFNPSIIVPLQSRGLSMDEFPRLASETDDSGRIQRAINAATANSTFVDYIGGQTFNDNKTSITGTKIFFPSGVYTIPSGFGGFQLDGAYCRIEGEEGAVIDARNMTSGTLFTIGNTVTFFGGIKRPILSNLTLWGPSTANTTTAIQVGLNSTLSGQGQRLEGLLIQGFNVQVNYNYNSWGTLLRNVYMDKAVTNAIYYPNGIANAAEKNIIEDSLIVNCAGDGVYCNSSLELRFVNCSFDYSGRAMNIQGGIVTCLGCHFEGDDNLVTTGANEYIYTNSAAAITLILDKCDIVPYFTGGKRAQIITLAGNNNLCTLRDCQVFTGTGASTIPLGATTGGSNQAFMLDGVTCTTSSIIPLPANASAINNGGFETGDLTSWTTSGTAPTVTNTQKHSGTYSAEWTTAAAITGAITQKCNIKPGQNIGFRLAYYLPSAPSSGNLNVTVNYLDSMGNLLATMYFSKGNQTLTTTGAWTVYSIQSYFSIMPPQGTVQAQLQVGVNGFIGTAYLDDLDMWVM